MQGEEGDEPSSSVVKLCVITASQEEILKRCPFAREPKKYPDPDPNSLTASSQNSTSSEVPTVIMVTPPESDRCGVDKSTPQEEDEEDTYLTPRENSLSDDPPQLPFPPPESEARGVSEDSQALAVCLGEDGEEDEEKRVLQLDTNLEGFEGDHKGGEEDSLGRATLEALSGNVKEKEPETEVGNGEDELMVDRTVDCVSEGETLGVFTVQFNTNGESCDCVIKDHEMEKVDVDSEECDGELGLDKQRVDRILDSAEEEVEGDKGSRGVNMHKNGVDNCSGSESWSLLENRNKNGLTCEGRVLGSESEKLGKNGKRNRDSNCEELRGVSTSGGSNLLEDGRGIDGICRGERLSRNSDGSGELSKDDLGKDGCGSSGVCEIVPPEKVLREVEKVSDNLKYVCGIDEMLSQGKKSGVSREKAPPLPVSEERMDMEGVSKRMKGEPLTESSDILKCLFNEADHGSKCDFLETAKRQGMVLPRPRWWPPEMND